MRCGRNAVLNLLLILIQIIRDSSGVPEVLTRLDPSPIAEPATEYES